MRGNFHGHDKSTPEVLVVYGGAGSAARQLAGFPIHMAYIILWLPENIRNIVSIWHSQ